MTKPLRIVLVLVLMSIWARQAAAQALAAEDRAQVVRTNIQKLADSTLRSPVSPPTLQLLLEADTSDRTGTIRLGLQQGDFLLDLKLRSPLDETTGRAELADLEGLRNQASVDVGTTWIRWEPQDPGPVLIEACTAYAAAIGKDVRAVDCRLSELRKLKTAEGQAAADQVIARIDPGVMIFLGGRLRLGRKRFGFLDSLTLRRGSETHTTYAGTLSGGLLTRQSYYLAVNYTHEVSYRAGFNTEICVPLGTIDGLRCDEEVVGAPRRDPRDITQLELRKFLGTVVGINPKIAYDFRRDVTAIEIPVYFLRNKDRGLTGGVSVGWRSDRGAVTMTAFVGHVLGLITQP